MAYPVSGSPYLGTSASPAYTGVFIPTLWSGKLVEKFYAATVLGAISNTDYEGEIRNQGDTVKIRTKPTITIATYDADQALAVQRPSSNVIDLLIDKGKYFNLVLDDVFEIQSDLDLMGLWADDAAQQFKTSIDTEVLNYLGTTTDIAATNRGAAAGAITGAINLGAVATPRTVDASTNSIVDFIVDCGQVLDEANIPEAGRFMVLPAWACAFIKKSDLKDASLAGDSTSIVRNGRLGMIDRFTIYMSNLITPLGVGTDEYPVIFGVNDGLTFASQFTKMETLRSESTFGTLMRGLQVYGYKVVNNVAVGRAIIT